MTNKPLARVYSKAKSEGRLCVRCGWIVTKKDYDKGLRHCAACVSALKGVNVSYGWNKPNEEKEDITGEAL